MAAAPAATWPCAFSSTGTFKKGDQVLACECCQRILYYNPPAPVEDLTGEPAPAAQE